MEDEHVHKVYEEIASHFSSTRYKPWPRVDQYMKSQLPGSIGADIGGGNGKYLGYPHVYMIGYDRSLELTKIANEKSSKLNCADAFRCDGLVNPLRPVDFAISIAVVHHFSTKERRVEAIRSILRALKPTKDSTALVYVWALEQASSRRGWDVGMDQDVMVPWVDNHDPNRKFERFYHLYRKGELEEDVIAAGGVIVESGYEKDNWWTVISNSESTS